jgi:hypothetical protein
MTMMAEPERRSVQEAVADVSEAIEDIIPEYERAGRFEFPDSISVGQTEVETSDVVGEVSDFLLQMRSNSLNYIVKMTDIGLDLESPAERSVDVLVKVPGLHSETRGPSYERFLEVLRGGGLRIERVERNIARKTFVKGLAEFLVTRASSGVSSGPPVTVVHSNRRGDTVLYAFGFFLSTGTAFGTSTPALVALPSGRYSFGIMQAAGPRYESFVWGIPSLTPVTVNLP